MSVCGCGGTGDESSATSAGSAGMNSISGASSGGSATAGASPGGATSGGSTTAVKSCTGQFGTPLLVFVEDPQFTVNGVSVTGDELEVYYSQGLSGSPTLDQKVVRRTRGSTAAAFGQVEPMPGLTNVCEPGQRVNPDVTDDGLTLYVTCSVDVPTGQDEGFSPLKVARRADRKSAFTLDAQSAGSVFGSASLSADELTAYTDGEIYDTPPQMFTRSAKNGPFSAHAAVPGLTTAFNSPDIANDGLTIFGSALTEAGTTRAIFRAIRQNQATAFEAPVKLELGLEGTFGAPNITPGCALYFANIMAGRSNSSVYVAQPK